MSTVLIGVDATARSEDAVALARQLALTFAGDVIVAAITHDHVEGDVTVRRMAGLLAPGIEPGRIRRTRGARRVHLLLRSAGVH